MPSIGFQKEFCREWEQWGGHSLSPAHMTPSLLMSQISSCHLLRFPDACRNSLSPTFSPFCSLSHAHENASSGVKEIRRKGDKEPQEVVETPQTQAQALQWP